MRAREILPHWQRGLRTYRVRLKLPQSRGHMQMWTTVQARNPDQARRIIRAQYGNTDVMVGNPRLMPGINEDTGATVSGNIAVVTQPLGTIQHRWDQEPAKYANTWRRSPRNPKNVDR